MEINSTLFIQCIHFMIAYMVIKRFLLRPAYMFIKNERDKRQRLIKSLEKRRGIVAHKEQAMHVGWQNYVQAFSTHIPRITDQELHLFTYEPPAHRSLSFDAQFINNEAERIEQSIVRAIRHHYE